MEASGRGAGLRRLTPSRFQGSGAVLAYSAVGRSALVRPHRGARSSAGEHPVYTRAVGGSNPSAPTSDAGVGITDTKTTRYRRSSRIARNRCQFWPRSEVSFAGAGEFHTGRRYAAKSSGSPRSPCQFSWRRQSDGTRPAGPGTGCLTGWCSGGARFGPVVEGIVRVAPEPVLARLEGAHDADARCPRRACSRAVTASESQHPMWPHCAHRRRWNHQPSSWRGTPRTRRRWAARSGRCPASSCVSTSSVVRLGGSIGRRTWNRVSPGRDSTRRSPWCLLTTMRHEMSSPRPVPSPTSLVVKNGSKIRALDVVGDARSGVADLDQDLVARRGRCGRSACPRRPSRRRRCRSDSSTPG